MPFYTPLRYPGGKRRLLSVVSSLIEENQLDDVVYAEPFAGGAAVALALLFEEYASTIYLNDLSRSIFAFWDSVINDTDALCSKIRSSPLNIDEWHRQRAVYDARESADFSDLGFAILFLNRTNRSGIIGGGVIGGKNQAGGWPLDARFNRNELIYRIEKIGRYRDRIRIYQMEALDFTEKILNGAPQRVFAFFDPPYIRNGKDLYLNNYCVEDHFQLSSRIQGLGQPWICTYDRAAIELGLFPHHRTIEYGLKYTTQGRYEGREVMFLSQELALPQTWLRNPSKFLLDPSNRNLRLYGTLQDNCSLSCS